MLLAVSNEFGFVDGHSGPQSHCRDHDFSPLRIRRADHGGHIDGGMSVEHFFDTVRENILAAADDHVLLAIG